MIEIKELTKIYKLGKQKECRALDGVSFSLPDTGLVFVIGKSGCGKSTLLNLLGGLDKLSSGDVIVDGNSFANFSERDFDNYRNNYLGFIFQDFCLLDNMTVRENVALALELQQMHDDRLIDEVLVQTQIHELSDRKIKELSGGQKQRVAIARALIKKPKLILADEPTGNLDAKTGKQILEILKTLSKTSLVVIVSHNRKDADIYADRIVELSDGRIISNVQRNDKSVDLEFSGNDIIFQQGTVFSDEQLCEINKKIEKGKFKLKQVNNRFSPAKQIEVPQSQPAELTNKHLSPKGTFRLLKIFTSKRIFGLILTSLLVACLMALLGICQAFTQFNANSQINTALMQNDEHFFIMQKGYTTEDVFHETRTDRLVRIDDQEFEKICSEGYAGNVYKLYNTGVVTGEHSYMLERRLPINNMKNYRNFYAYEGCGVLQCDEETLKNVYGYGEKGAIDVVSGEIKTDTLGIIVTDYFADSILFHNPNLISFSSDKYSNLINTLLFNRYSICAIINTNYKERYSKLIEMFRNQSDSINKTKSIYKSQLYGNFVSELNSTLNVAYTFNPNYYEKLIEDNGSIRNFARITEGILSIGNNSLNTMDSAIYLDEDLTDNEVILSSNMYAAILGIEIDDVDFEGAKGKVLTVSNFETGATDGKAQYEWELTIKEVIDTPLAGIWVSYDKFCEAKRYDIINYALYFDQTDNILSLYNKASKLSFAPISQTFKAIYSVTEVVDIFSRFFAFIVVILCTICAALLVFFSLGSIRKNTYEIGVLRALGSSSRDLSFVFMLQTAFVCLTICLLGILGMLLGSNFCNNMLIDGFINFTNNPMMTNIEIIALKWDTILIDSSIIIALSFLSTITPFIALRKIKPREIIRAKE